MKEQVDGHVTRLLRRLSSGDAQAKEELLPFVYHELHQSAHRQLQRERPDHTLQTTELADLVYLELVDEQDRSWESRTQFANLAATAIRRALIDHARKRRSLKHGGGNRRVPLEEWVASYEHDHVDLLDLNDALEQLGELDPILTRVVELRFFGGLTEEQTASALGRPLRTVQRDWQFARTWLHRRLGGTNGHEC